MLVLKDSSLRWHSEKRVAGWLRDPTDGWSQPGVAVAGCLVFGAGASAPQQVDFLVFTPWSLIVVEVKGLPNEIIDGEIIAEPNDRWYHDLSDIEPVHTRARDTNPLDQALDAAYTLKSLATQHNPDHPYVHAAVVLVPARDATLTVRHAALPPGTAVALGETGLHTALNATQAQRPTWTAEQVYSMLNALGLGRRITLGDLTAEGFPTLDPTTVTPRPTRHTTPPPRPITSTYRAGAAPRSARPARAPRTVIDTGRPRAPRGTHLGQQAAAIAVIVTAVAAIWWLVVHVQPDPNPAPPQPIPSTVHEPGLGSVDPSPPSPARPGR